MVWGTCLEKNCPSSHGHLLVFGGSEPLPGGRGQNLENTAQGNSGQNATSLGSLYVPREVDLADKTRGAQRPEVS